jgi:hypothetical protein
MQLKYILDQQAVLPTSPPTVSTDDSTTRTAFDMSGTSSSTPRQQVSGGNVEGGQMTGAAYLARAKKSLRPQREDDCLFQL